MEEPSLREVLSALNTCKVSLFEMTDQLKSIKEDMSFLRHDLQKVDESATTLKGRDGLVEDFLTPIKLDIDATREIGSTHIYKMEDLANHLPCKMFLLWASLNTVKVATQLILWRSDCLKFFGKDSFTSLFAMKSFIECPSDFHHPGPHPDLS